jgi:ubiquinone/menaquinone biosynthesis C-methylase UbiE
MSKHTDHPNICDYEGSNYRTDFWEGKGRDYEDRVERTALRRLLPRRGRRLLEIGAGFGRLTDEYHAYEQVILLDYSLSQLQDAQEHLGPSDRYLYVAADAYKLPFRPGVFDGATMIRVIHHMSDVPKALAQVRRVMIPGGTFILEHANKRNIKSMLRHALKRQSWSPYDLTPVEFVELNFDFHPEYMRHALHDAGFRLERRIPVSFFRVRTLKNRLPTGALASLDSFLQWTGVLYTPSIFTRNIALNLSPNNMEIPMLFTCPECGGELQRDGDVLVCRTDALRWAIRDGIYDFKAPLE